MICGSYLDPGMGSMVLQALVEGLLISYPYEESCSQYKDAASLRSRSSATPSCRGISLKNCSALNNVQFHEGRPILIDTLSLELYGRGGPGSRTGSSASISSPRWL